MLSFQDLSFSTVNEKIRVEIYNLFYKEFDQAELSSLGKVTIKYKKLEIQGLSQDAVQKKFMQFFRKYKKDLAYKLNGNKAIYVDEDLGLPLIGLNFLGILDKGSEIIELKPITNCNADCIFCSVNEGPSSNKKIDFVVDKDFIVQETKALLKYKDARGMSIWINPHGEPTLYAKLSELCRDLLEDEHVKDIHIITNGILLTKKMADELCLIAEQSKKEIHINLSMSALSVEPGKASKVNKKGLSNARLMMGEIYTLTTVLRNLEYAADKLPVTITPVYVRGMNDEEMKNLVLFADKVAKSHKNKKIGIAIQKYCENKRGRNPVNEESWDDFFAFLKQLEQETGKTLTPHLGKIKETKQLPLLCKKGEKIVVKLICQGRYPRDKLGIYETKQGSRAVALIGCDADKGTTKAEVIQSKYNMVVGKCT